MGAEAATAVRVLDAEGGPELPIVEGPGTARAIVWPGIGAEHRSMHRITLGEGAATVELRHPGEAVYYVVDGAGEAVDPTSGEGHRLEPGSMVHIGPGTAYLIRARSGGLEVIGGPSPPDPELYGSPGEAGG
jgi:quercetin dioxygenase-like cupin family protein